MVRERIADDVYVFTSRRYAQVTVGAILTREGVILIDTFFYPEETRAVKQFLEQRLGLPIRYVINTHYHADHTLGNCLFPQAQLVSHRRCRELLQERGRAGLDQMKAQSAEFSNVSVVLPEMVFEQGDMTFHLADKTVTLYHLPGHSADLVGVWVADDRILFASDNMMPVPTIFDGHLPDLQRSLCAILEKNPDFVVQGHGEVILRGEIESLIESDLAYLNCIQERVADFLAADRPEEALATISIESCGKSRIPLNGLVADLHQANLRKLYQELLAVSD
jgi:cyclase